jgi:hypothetical protein
VSDSRMSKYAERSYLLAIIGAAYIPTAEAEGFTPASVKEMRR